MKRLDEFELYHERRKRRPLGDITGLANLNTQNTQKRKQSAAKPPFKARSGLAEKGKQTPHLLRHAQATPGNAQIRKQSPSISALKQAFQTKSQSETPKPTLAKKRIVWTKDTAKAQPHELPLLESLTDYSELVAESNTAIRSFMHSIKLQTASGLAEEMFTVGHVTRLGPYLHAVGGPEAYRLVMGPAPTLGQRIRLHRHLTFGLDGHVSVYRWTPA